MSIAYANPLTPTDALTALNNVINDTDNFTFTADQKNTALTTAWNDTWVMKTVWDSSITYSSGTWQYAVPASMTTVFDIYLSRDTDQYPEPIDSSLWEVVAGQIQFLARTRWVISDTYTLYIKGGYKLTTSDALDTPELQNYVVNLAAYKLFEQLAKMKVFRFLRNDTTMADILNAKRDFGVSVAEYRQALQRTFRGV